MVTDGGALRAADPRCSCAVCDEPGPRRRLRETEGRNPCGGGGWTELGSALADIAGESVQCESGASREAAGGVGGVFAGAPGDCCGGSAPACDEGSGRCASSCEGGRSGVGGSGGDDDPSGGIGSTKRRPAPVGWARRDGELEAVTPPLAPVGVRP
jgi:hypothetical protein